MDVIAEAAAGSGRNLSAAGSVRTHSVARKDHRLAVVAAAQLGRIGLYFAAEAGSQSGQKMLNL